MGRQPRHLGYRAPALLLGNLDRAVLFRRFIERRTALQMIAGALPGAFIGSLLPGAMPAWVLQVLLVALTLLAIARACNGCAMTCRARAWRRPRS